MATPAAVEADIHAIMKARQEAVRAKAAARLVAHHASDVVAYDLLERCNTGTSPICATSA